MNKRADFKRKIVALCALVYFTSYFSRKSFAATLFGMLEAGAITETTGGLVETFLFICYGAGQLISGFLGDRVKPSVLLGGGLLVTALCNASIPLLPSGEWMIPIWALNGLAQAMLWPPIVRILASNLHHEEYVRANLVVTVFAHIATILLYLYVPLCLRYVGWQAAFYSAGILSLLAMTAFLIAIARVLPHAERREEEGVKKKQEGERGGLFSVLLSSGVLPILGVIIACGILRDGIETWLPTLYGQAFGRESGEATLVSAVLPIFSVAAVSAVTALHRRPLFNNEIRGAVVLFLLCAGLCVPLFLLISSESTVARFICLFLSALICASMHGVNFLLISCLPGRFASLGRSATVGGFVNAFVYVGAASATYGFALISQKAGWGVTILSWIGVAAVGILLSLWAYRKYTAFIEKDE